MFSMLISQTSWPWPCSMALALYTAIPTRASGDTKGDGGVTSCIGFTFTSSSAGPGCYPVLNRFLEVAGLRAAGPPKAHPPCNLAEIGVLQVGVYRHEAGRLLLDVDKPELAVV